MTEAQRKLRDEAADNMAQFCRCAGPTCSGCEANTKTIFKLGHDFAHERAQVLVEALEVIANQDYRGNKPPGMLEARAALAEWRGE